MHMFCFGETDRATHQPLESRPQIDVLALDLLRVLLAYRMVLRVDMSLVGPPAIRVIPGDAKRRQEGFEPQKDVILTPTKHVRQHLPTLMIDRVPQPPWVRLFAHITPHFVKL